ncbi:MAG: hypothetical protein LBO72_00805 [Helicobacteraceae bacterium]|jgi:hypothetical protein|nr:hypothetical protein [Helicobacteraceae bacterium]
MKYAKLILILLVLAFGLNVQDAYGEDDLNYPNAFHKVLRLSNDNGVFIDVKLQCKKDGKNFTFKQLDYFGHYNYDDRNRSDIRKLKESGISLDVVFLIEFSEQQKNGDKVIVSENAILHTDSPSRFHFSFANDPRIINFELADPKMKPITYRTLPKNSKTEIANDGYVEDIYIFDIVRLWENNATDQKMTCDILAVLY